MDIIYEVNDKLLADFYIKLESQLNALAENRPEINKFEVRSSIYSILGKQVASNVPISYVFAFTEIGQEDEFEPIEKTVREFGRKNAKPTNLYEDWLVRYIDNIDTLVKTSGASLVLYGLDDVGKTFTGIHLLINALVTDMQGYYIPFYKNYKQLVEKVAYNKNSTEQEERLLEYIQGCDFLVVDEIGKENVTDASKAVLQELIKTRSLNKKPTILITNLRFNATVKTGATTHYVNEFENAYGSAVFTALSENYKILEFSSQDRSGSGESTRLSMRKKFASAWEKLEQSIK